MNPTHLHAQTQLIPDMAQVRHLLPILADQTTPSEVADLIEAVWRQTGTPAHPQDWSQPEVWIIERLTGEEAALAMRIWRRSQHAINPRHLSALRHFVHAHQLLTTDRTGIYRLSPRGQAFLADDPATMWEIEDAETIPDRLYSPLKTLHLYPHGTRSVKRRVLNLIEGHYLLARAGNTYHLPAQHRAQADPHAVDRYNRAQKRALREHLARMDPYRFEALIRDLLEAMGYTEVTLTKQSGDKGVDVIANHTFGITPIRQGVQVKRYRGRIHRHVLDQLRGALPYHQATSGAIVTLGSFTKGCIEVAVYPGAPDITLIDGDTLVELLIKHGVGIHQDELSSLPSRAECSSSILEIDVSYFADPPAS